MNTNERSLDNRRLVVLLDTLREHPDDTLYEELFTLIAESSYFYVAAHFDKQPVRQKDGSYLLQNDTHMTFPRLYDDNGVYYYPAFTSLDELEKWQDEEVKKASILTLCIDDFLDMLHHDEGTSGVVINPYTQSFLLFKGMMEHLYEVREKAHPFHRHTILEHLYKNNKDAS